jgi:hypothetical protein
MDNKAPLRVVEFPKGEQKKKLLLHYYAVEKEGSSTASGSSSGTEGRSGISNGRWR